MHHDARGTLKALVGSHAGIQAAPWACSLMPLLGEVAPTSQGLSLSLPVDLSYCHQPAGKAGIKGQEIKSNQLYGQLLLG